MAHARSALLLLASALSFGCGSDSNQDPEAGTSLLDRVRNDRYTTWQKAPGFEKRQPGTGPHGDMIDVYVNPVVANALAGGPVSAWPEGSLIVKDGFEGGTHKYVAIMEKHADGWFWTETHPDGEVLASGTPSLCTGCHSSGQDMVRSFSLPK
jgi:hypothetical protein